MRLIKWFKNRKILKEKKEKKELVRFGILARIRDNSNIFEKKKEVDELLKNEAVTNYINRHKKENVTRFCIGQDYEEIIRFLKMRCDNVPF